jgi:hypothetical protein
MRKFHTSPNVTHTLIFPMVSASIPGTTLWNGTVYGLRADRGMPMSSSVMHRAR